MPQNKEIKKKIIEMLMGAMTKELAKDYTEGILELFSQKNKKMAEEKNLITIGYHKGKIDFGVNCSVANLSLKELKELREMIIVAIWCAEDMWRRNQKKEVGTQSKN